MMSCILAFYLLGGAALAAGAHPQAQEADPDALYRQRTDPAQAEHAVEIWAVRAAAGTDFEPEGHFWLAANMGALAESFGMTQGLRYRGRIKAALERVLKIDPGWQQGSADRALGWWYHKVPGLFGGSEERAEMHLRRALGYNPQSTATLYFLAEVLLERDKDDEARTMLQRTLDAPLDPDWMPEDEDFKTKARARLTALAGR
jgi:hypothetical protein